MDNNNNGKLYIIRIIAFLSVCVFLLANFHSSRHIRILLIVCAVIAAVILVIVCAAVFYAIKSGKDEYDKTHKVQPVKNSSNQHPDAMNEAKSYIAHIQLMCSSVCNKDIKLLLEECSGNAERILKQLEKQPDNIGKNHQFFNYYLPTLTRVVEKYRNIEAGGVNSTEVTENTVNCLKKMNTAFNKIFENLFSDDILDLSVETKALETIIEKDGLQ